MSQLPLASSQCGIWFDQMLHSGQPIYNMSGCLRIMGPIDRGRFEAATHELVRRNDILRIVLRAGVDLPVQEILPAFVPPLHFLDFSGAVDAQARAHDWMRAQVELPPRMFDEPLFAFALIKIRDDEYWWFHTYHHIICDAYGHSLLVNALAAIYSGTADALPVYSYVDYINADAALQASPKWDADLAYWGERFASLPAPMVETKGFGDAVAHDRHILTLPRAFYDRMNAFAAEHDASTFHLILAALYVRFARAGDRDDFIIGLPTLNRGTAAFKATAGLFTGVSPAWFVFGRDLTTPALLKAIAADLRRDYRHQRIPLHEINRRAGLYGTGRPQIFDIILSYQKHSYDVRFDGYPVEQISLRHGAEKTPLAFEVSEYNDALDVQININYSTTAFTRAEVEHLGEQLYFVLDAMMHDPAAALRDLAILSPAERALVLGEDRTPLRADRADETLVDRIEAHARATPEAIALTTNTGDLTYGALDRQANQCAAYLRARGVLPGSRVGIALERTASYPVGVLAILKAGAAFVPLDPADSPQRRAIVAAAGVDVILTDTDGLESVLPGSAALCASASDAACVMFAPGPGDAPKGTVLTHHNLMRLFAGMDEALEGGRPRVGALFHPFTQDLSLFELFGALVHAERAVMVPYWVSRSPEDAVHLLVESGVNILSVTPQECDALIAAEAAGAQTLRSLHALVVAGDASAAALLPAWCARTDGGVRVIAAYGSTETSIFAAYAPLGASAFTARRTRIARPLRDTWMYVLDRSGEPLPVGVPGDVYVSGAGVAAGYVAGDGGDATHFRADPFRPGARMFATGDRGRFLPDGTIELLRARESAAGAAHADADPEVRPAAQDERTRELAAQLAAIWGQELEVERVGLHDNIFDLGGHSLLLVRVGHRIATELGIEFTITELFAHPTIATLARAAAQMPQVERAHA